MRQETQHWNKILAMVEILLGGSGQTGLSPSVAIKRVSDGLWLNAAGTGWTATTPSGGSVHTMAELDATDLPGVYGYVIPPAQLSYDDGLAGYYFSVAESSTSLREYVLVTAIADASKQSGTLWTDAVGSYSGTAGSTAEKLVEAGTSGSTAAIASAVWDKPRASHIAVGSFGLLAQITAGMVQANHRLMNPTYDAEGRMLTADLVVYPTGPDAAANTSALSTFNVTMTYDGSGNLTTLLSRE